MRISDWSSDVCSSDLLKCYRNLARAWLCRLPRRLALRVHRRAPRRKFLVREDQVDRAPGNVDLDQVAVLYQPDRPALGRLGRDMADRQARGSPRKASVGDQRARGTQPLRLEIAGRIEHLARKSTRSEEHTSELQSLMRISSAL